MTAALLALILSIGVMPMPKNLRLEAMARVMASYYGLDEERVCCIIQAESQWNPNALGKAGERGLMQILPATGDFFAAKMGMPRNPDLWDPAMNLSLGCWGLAMGYEHWWMTMEGCDAD